MPNISLGRTCEMTHPVEPRDVGYRCYPALLKTIDRTGVDPWLLHQFELSSEAAPTCGLFVSVFLQSVYESIFESYRVTVLPRPGPSYLT